MKEDIMDLSDFNFAVTAQYQGYSDSRDCPDYTSYLANLASYEEAPSVNSDALQVALSLFEPNSLLSDADQATYPVRLTSRAATARERYHRMTPDERRKFNRKKTSQKRKQSYLQRRREMEELDDILMASGDLEEPTYEEVISEQLAKKRARWAADARERYARLTPEERRLQNAKRNDRQWRSAMKEAKESLGAVDKADLENATKQIIKRQNAKKAERARLRYHRMSDEEKKQYNLRRDQQRKERKFNEARTVFVQQRRTISTVSTKIDNKSNKKPRKSTRIRVDQKVCSDEVTSPPEATVSGEEMISGEATVSEEIDSTLNRRSRMANRRRAKPEVCSQEVINPAAVPASSGEMVSGEASISTEEIQIELFPYPQINQEELNFFAAVDQSQFMQVEKSSSMEYHGCCID